MGPGTGAVLLALWVGTARQVQDRLPDEARPPRATLSEHRLEVRSEGEPQPAPDEGLISTPRWELPARHIEGGRAFADPFLGPEVYPEASVGSSLALSHVAPRGQVRLDSRLTLSLYLLDVVLPIHALADGQESRPRVEVSGKLPLALGDRHRVALLCGVGFPPVSGEAVDVRYDALYAFAAESGVGLQLRASYLLRPSDSVGPRELFLGYGAVVSVRMGGLLPLLEIDGDRHGAGAKVHRLRVLPGVRFFPRDVDSLNLGLAGLLALGGPGAELAWERVGLLVNLGFNFL